MKKIWNDKKKKFIVLIIYVNIVAVLLGFSLVSVATGKANIVINGIAVDSNGLVYVGHDKGIDVYNHSEFVKKIQIPTSRGYNFTIEDDNILLSTGDYTYLMNLNGEILSKQPDTYANHIYSKNSFESTGGDSFKIKSVLFKTKIVKNNDTTVYQISDRDLIAKLILEISALSVPVVVFCIIKIFKSSRQKAKG